MAMLSIPNNRLVSPEEAIDLSFKREFIDVYSVVHDIADNWTPLYSNEEFDCYCMLSAIYTAGYIQGKREERRRLAERKAKAAAKY